MPNSEIEPEIYEQAERRYRKFLSERKMFYTRERSLILEAVLKHQEHFSVDELLFDMQQQGMRVSRATLYRTLSQMADANILSSVDFGHGHAHYENTLRPSHEHLVCKGCGKVVEVASPSFIQAVKDLAATEGFDVVSHKAQIFGICLNCKDKPK